MENFTIKQDKLLQNKSVILCHAVSLFELLLHGVSHQCEICENVWITNILRMMVIQLAGIFLCNLNTKLCVTSGTIQCIDPCIMKNTENVD